MSIFTIPTEILVSVNVDGKSGDVMLGTYNGFYYRMSARGIIMSTTQISSKLGILNIQHNNEGVVIVQTIAGVHLVEGQLNEHVDLDVERPMCCATHKDKIIVQNKYGKFWILPRFSPKELYASYLLPEGVTYALQRITPWYNNGIYVSDDGSEINTLYPEGHIVVRKIKK